MLTSELVTLMNLLSLRTLTKLMKRKTQLMKHIQTRSALNSSKRSYSGNPSILKAYRVKERQENGVLAATAKSLFYARSAEVKGQLDPTDLHTHVQPSCTSSRTSAIRHSLRLAAEAGKSPAENRRLASPAELGIQNLPNSPHVVLTAI